MSPGENYFELGGPWVAGGAAGGVGGANGAVTMGGIVETCFFLLCPII